MKSIALIVFSSVLFFSMITPGEDQKIIRKIFDVSLTDGQSHDNLRELCKDVGHRLTGSHGDTLAVLWSEKKLKDLGYDNVRLQPFQAPFWKRNGPATGKIITESTSIDISLLALGSSVGTGKKGVKANVIEIHSWNELEERKEEVKGKIVFYNRPMDPRNVNTFDSYVETVDQRSQGAVEAAKYGAIASLVRSVTLTNDDHPHTGNMRYSDEFKKIPGLAISAEDANTLHETLSKEGDVLLQINSMSENLGTVESNNVMGEIIGSEFPEKVIVVSGHLDSWDVGDGAHDDGSGIVHAMEIKHLFDDAGYKPRHTIRVVCYMNEENGVAGGKAYAKSIIEKKEEHIAAIESDAGAFSPRGFTIEAIDEKQKVAFEKIKRWAGLLAPYNLHYFEIGYSGTDIRPLKPTGTVNFGLVPDSQRYFDFHHTEADVFEAVNKRELELGCASIASLVYLIDKHGLE